MLAAGAAETVQDIAGQVMAALDGDRLDRLGHVLDGDGDEAFGKIQRVGRAAGGFGDLGGEGVELPGDSGLVQRLVAARAEDGGKELGAELAQQDVAVGHRQGAAATVGGGAGHGAGGLGADAQA